MEQPMTSIVRRNLMEQPGYTPYCGAENCLWSWPRTRFDGSQFACACGWKSSFEAEFIEQYKQRKPTGDAETWSNRCLPLS
jgi:hypothetical protein